MARFNRRQVEEPVVNLTPLIDVVFVILIMFILIAPLLDQDRVELAEASKDRAGGEVHEASLIALHVHQDNSIWLNGNKVGSEQLVFLLKEAKKKYPAARLQLFHDKRGQFGTYQMIKNAAEQAGFENMDVILKP